MTTDPTIGKDGKQYPLTPKQHAFINAYLETSNASESYRRAYKPNGWTDRAIWVAGSKALDNPKIAAAIASKRASVAAKVAVTVETLIAECDEAKELAKETKNAGAFVSATQLKAKLTNNLTDKIDQTVRQATPEEHKPDLSNLRRDSVATAAGTAETSGPEAQPGDVIH